MRNIKLPQAVKVLTPVAIFVTMNHIYIFLEILGETARDHAIMLTICTPISILFLIYSYAIMMNGKAADLFNERNEEFAAHQDCKFGPVHEDMNMKTCRLNDSSLAAGHLSKKE